MQHQTSIERLFALVKDNKAISQEEIETAKNLIQTIVKQENGKIILSTLDDFGNTVLHYACLPRASYNST
jgi:hypothetical protein